MDILKVISEEKSLNLPMTDKIYNMLLRDILTGIIPAGQKLTENFICKEYKTSRTPAREALMQLKLTGLVEIIPMRGAFVKGVSQHNIKDILLMRGDMEIRAAQWASQRITKEEVKNLDEIMSHMEFYTRKNDIPKMIDINSGFHRLIYNGAHNHMLETELITYQKIIHYLCPSNYFANRYLETVLNEHRMIYNAVVRGNSEAAEVAMKIHMEKSIGRKL